MREEIIRKKKSMIASKICAKHRKINDGKRAIT